MVCIRSVVILTNSQNPESVSATDQIRDVKYYEKTGVEALKRAPIGAGAACDTLYTSEKWVSGGAGSVATRSVKDYAPAEGNTARQVGWANPTDL
jgi:acetyltransferase-like isoleucine patch superfamily enzyme